MTAESANTLLTKTLNVGLHLGGPKDDGWCIHPTKDTWNTIKSAGFSAVRLGVQWAAHCEMAAPYAIEKATFTAVDQAVQEATAQGLAVVISNFLDPELMQNPEAYKQRFLAITRQVTAHYKSSPNTVLIELLAEPQAKLDAVWNEYLVDALTEVRKISPERVVIVGPVSYNNARMLPKLQLPEDDRNLIVTLHHYWPLKFTFQGESFFYEQWQKMPFLFRLLLGNPKSWPGTTWHGTPREQAVIRSMLAKAAVWSKEHNRPIFVGEFGSSNTADMPSRARWAAFVRSQCETYGFSWGYWSYGPSFALYDIDNSRWHSEILDALMDSSK